MSEQRMGDEKTYMFQKYSNLIVCHERIKQLETERDKIVPDLKSAVDFLRTLPLDCMGSAAPTHDHDGYHYREEMIEKLCKCIAALRNPKEGWRCMGCNKPYVDGNQQCDCPAGKCR